VSTPGPDRSTSARLAKASERLTILAHELHIAVVDAADSGPDLALLAGVSSRLSSHTLDLAEINFAVAEDVVSSSGDARADRSAAALGRVSRVVDPVFEVASEVAAHLVICAERAARTGGALTASHLSALNPALTRLLEENQHLVTGAGVAMAPHTLADEELWMQWFVQGPAGPVQLRPRLDPRSEAFYDYPSAVWFSESAHELAPRLAPPHFDGGGTDTWMVTAAVPVVVQGRFLGLGCAELTLDRIGSLVAPALLAMPAPAALVSPQGVVVASTHPDMHPGTTPPQLALHLASGNGATSFAHISTDLTVARSPALAWQVVADWSASPS